MQPNADGSGGSVRRSVAQDRQPGDGLVNMSNGSNADWDFYSVPATQALGGVLAYADTVKLAVDADNVYIVATYKHFKHTGRRGGRRQPLRQGDSIRARRYKVEQPGRPAGVSTLTPVQNTDPTATTATQLFVDTTAATGIRIWQLDSNGEIQASPNAIVAGTTFTSHTTGAHQFGTSLQLDTGGDQIAGAVLVGGSIFAAQTVDVGGLATARWYRINAATGALQQSGDVTDTASGGTRAPSRLTCRASRSTPPATSPSPIPRARRMLTRPSWSPCTGRATRAAICPSARSSAAGMDRSSPGPTIR